MIAVTLALMNKNLPFDLRASAPNREQLAPSAFIAGQAQTLQPNPHGRYQLFRIGDAVSSRNTHAAIYDALRLCHVI